MAKRGSHVHRNTAQYLHCAVKNLNWISITFSHCLYLILNTQETSHFYWHQFWDKMMMKIYAIEIIFRSHEPFQSYLLTGQADSAKKAG